MRFFVFISLSALIFFSCHTSGIEISKNSEYLLRKNGITFFKGLKFTGVLRDTYSDGLPKSLTSFKMGIRHGYLKEWFSNKKLKSIKTYHSGKSVGVQKGFWDSGGKRYLYRYKNGVQHGTQFEWHQNGQLARKSTMRDGQLNGIQKGWREDGDIKFNFIYVNGKRYGFLGAELCVPPE